jgi:hypothetical protein
MLQPIINYMPNLRPPPPPKRLAYLTHVPKVTITFVMSPQPTPSPNLLIKTTNLSYPEIPGFTLKFLRAHLHPSSNAKKSCSQTHIWIYGSIL